MKERNMETARQLLNIYSADSISNIAGDMIDINNTVEIILDTLETEIESLAELLHSEAPLYTLKRYTQSLYYLLGQNREYEKSLLSIVDSAEVIREDKAICPSVWTQLEKQA